MLGVFGHDDVFLVCCLKRIHLVAEHFKLFLPGHGSRAPARGCHAALGEREIQEKGKCANSKEVLRFYRQDLTPPREDAAIGWSR